MTNLLILIIIVTVTALWIIAQFKLSKAQKQIDEIYQNEAILQKSLAKAKLDLDLQLKIVKHINTELDEKNVESISVINNLKNKLKEYKTRLDCINVLPEKVVAKNLILFGDHTKYEFSDLITHISGITKTIRRKEKPDNVYRITGFRFTKIGNKFELGLIPTSISEGKGTVKYYSTTDLVW